MVTMSAPDVHPGAQAQPAAEPDLFSDGAPTPTPAHPVSMEFRGVLIHDAEVRDKPIGDGQQFAPVLCIELQPLSGGGHTLKAQQVYSEATRALAVQRAQALRRGTRITLTTPLAGMRIFLPHVQAITTEA